MPIGLERGTVKIADHDTEWDSLAIETILKLNSILGDKAVDIQHVGSTSIWRMKIRRIKVEKIILRGNTISSFTPYAKRKYGAFLVKP